MEALLLVVEHNGPPMFARIGITRALNRKVVRVFNPSRKDRHWEKQNLETRRVTNSSCPQNAQRRLAEYDR
jgi:hypothetical protein